MHGLFGMPYSALQIGWQRSMSQAGVVICQLCEHAKVAVVAYHTVTQFTVNFRLDTSMHTEVREPKLSLHSSSHCIVATVSRTMANILLYKLQLWLPQPT
jgi:hypothetical protein